MPNRPRGTTSAPNPPTVTSAQPSTSTDRGETDESSLQYLAALLNEPNCKYTVCYKLLICVLLRWDLVYTYMSIN